AHAEGGGSGIRRARDFGDVIVRSPGGEEAGTLTALGDCEVSGKTLWCAPGERNGRSGTPEGLRLPNDDVRRSGKRQPGRAPAHGGQALVPDLGVRAGLRAGAPPPPRGRRRVRRLQGGRRGPEP